MIYLKILITVIIMVFIKSDESKFRLAYYFQDLIISFTVI